ncbi:hypothetical protein BKA70DRAFT_1351035 [Coprinopsis sp. MPI-PUGE-AT-0042]|nr:hypothetical protein BKA70DRAFT_1351035 [Coprinopsis sp. MPI-PUGE-AT-0042]
MSRMHHALEDVDILTCITEAVNDTDVQAPNIDPHANIAAFRRTYRAGASAGIKWLFQHLVFSERCTDEFIPPRPSLETRIKNYLSICNVDDHIPTLTKRLTVVCCRDHPAHEDHRHGVELAQPNPMWLSSDAFQSIVALLTCNSTVHTMEINMGLTGGGTRGTLVSEVFRPLQATLQHLHLSDIEGLPASFVLDSPTLKSLTLIRVTHAIDGISTTSKARLESFKHYGAESVVNETLLKRLDLSSLKSFSSGTCHSSDILALAAVLKTAKHTLQHVKIDFTSLISRIYPVLGQGRSLRLRTVTLPGLGSCTVVMWVRGLRNPFLPPSHRNSTHPSILSFITSLHCKGPLRVALECILDKDWDEFSWASLDEAVHTLALKRTNGYGLQLDISFKANFSGSIGGRTDRELNFFEAKLPLCHASSNIVCGTFAPGDVRHEGWDSP